MPCRGTLGKGRRVEHHDVVVSQFVGFEVFQRIGLDGGVGLNGQLVQSHIVFAYVKGPLGTVQAVDFRGACLHGVDAEPACVAEHIEHFFSLGQRSEQRTVFPLVEEESSLLAFFPVNVEAVTMFCGKVSLRGAPPNPAIFAGLAAVFEKGFRALVVDAHQGVSKGFFESFHERGKCAMHPWGVALHHQHAVVEVCDQARKAISFRMNQTACVLVGGLKEVQVSPNGHGLGNLHVPPCVVRAMLVKRKHAHCDARLRGVVSPSQRAALVGADLDPVSRLGVALDVLDATTEDPRVLPADALVAFGF